tara:strand:+ start:457 stop:1092 length:636 start_codon:yes stop_codon:yes gene_type:complete
MALSKFKPASFDLADNYAFTGTTSGLTDTNQLVLIKTLTADDSATNLTFVHGTASVVLDTTYKTYLFKLINIHPKTNDTNFTVNFRDGGTNYDATKTSTAFQAYHTEAGSGALGYVAADDLAQSTGEQVLFEGLGGDADQSLSGEMFLFNPSSTTFIKHYMYRACNSQQSDQFRVAYKAGYCNVTAAIDGVKFSISSGNIEAGTIKLYGIL